MIYMCAYARRRSGRLAPRPYTDRDARLYAHACLIPAELAERPDLDIARAAWALRVPEIELRAAQLDLDGHPVHDAATSSNASETLGRVQPALLLLGALDRPASAPQLLRDIRHGQLADVPDNLPVVTFGDTDALSELRAYEHGSDHHVAHNAPYVLVRAVVAAVLRRAAAPRNRAPPPTARAAPHRRRRARGPRRRPARQADPARVRTAPHPRRRPLPAKPNASERLPSAPEKKPSGVAGSASSTGYEAYGQFVKDELAAQDARKASFEQRGLAVITTAGTLVTLLFALAALSTKASATFVLPDAAHGWLIAALVLFFLAALAALAVNLPLNYEAVEAEKIRERLREKPPRTADAAARDIAFTRIDALEAAKKKNGIKGWILAGAMGLEALAVGSLGVAIYIIL